MVVTDTAFIVDIQVMFTAMVSLVPSQDAGSRQWSTSPLDWWESRTSQRVSASWPICSVLNPRMPSILCSFNLHQPPFQCYHRSWFLLAGDLALTARPRWLSPGLPWKGGAGLPPRSHTLLYWHLGCPKYGPTKHPSLTRSCIWWSGASFPFKLLLGMPRLAWAWDLIGW